MQAGGFTDYDVYDTLVAHLGTYTPPAESDVSVTVVDGAGNPLGDSCTNSTVGQNVEVSWGQEFELDVAFWKATTITREIEGVFRCE